jgi:hypothetical protein
MKFKLIVLFLMGVFMCSGVAFAAVNIEKREGDVKIFMPDGKQVIVKKEQQMPVIPDGAGIVLLGSCTVSTTGKSTAVVTIGSYTAQIKENSIIDLRLSPDKTVNFSILSGEALVTRKPEKYSKPPLPEVPSVQFSGYERPDISPSK